VRESDRAAFLEHHPILWVLHFGGPVELYEPSWGDAICPSVPQLYGTLDTGSKVGTVE
jgi:hypothetical protein